MKCTLSIATHFVKYAGHFDIKEPFFYHDSDDNDDTDDDYYDDYKVTVLCNRHIYQKGLC